MKHLCRLRFIFSGRSGSFVKLVACGFLILMAGCQWPAAMLEGNGDVEVIVHCPDVKRVYAVAAKVMAANGYVSASDRDPEEESFAVAYARNQNLVSRMVCFVRGGQDRVWIIAQPLPDGWELYAMPEPVGYDTSFSRLKFRRILDQIRRECD
jgi:hypothetical protein